MLVVNLAQTYSFLGCIVALEIFLIKTSQGILYLMSDVIVKFNPILIDL